MEISEQTLDVINDLIKINNDRAAGFVKAGTDLEGRDTALVPVFAKLSAESQQYADELTQIAQQSGGDVAEGTSTSGDLHRAWIDIKSAFTGSDVLAILNECERGEDAAKTAYLDALDPENELSYDVSSVLQRQQQGIVEGHDLIKTLRDKAQAADEAEDEIDDQEDEDEGKVTEPGFPITSASADPAGQGFVSQPATSGVASIDYDRGPDYVAGSEADEVEDDASQGNSKLLDFFVNELQDLLWAETELTESLPDMVDAATSPELKNAFQMHLTETETHIARLEQAFTILGLEPESRKCDAMAGILDEGDEIIEATEEGTAQRDVGLIFAGQKVEHYEIASYGGMIALAKTLGYYDIAELFVLTLDEEKTADAKLTEIAENQANYDASRELSDDEE